MPSMRMSYVYVANMHMRVRVASMRTTEGSYRVPPPEDAMARPPCASLLSLLVRKRPPQIVHLWHLSRSKTVFFPRSKTVCFTEVFLQFGRNLLR